MDNDVWIDGLADEHWTPRDRSTPTVHRRHDEPDLGGIGGTSEMRIDLFGFVLVQGNETVENVVACRGVVGAPLCNIRSLVLPSVGPILVELAFIVWEVILHRAHREFFLEPVDLVQEQDDRGLHEPPGVADGVKQRQGFLHPVDRLILEQQLVILGDGHEEQNGGDILETMDPLLPLGPLTTDIEHAIGEFADDERGLGDPGRLDPRAQHILVVG